MDERIWAPPGSAVLSEVYGGYFIVIAAAAAA
eukprot:CAMPEP_0175076304 /NCGR_PEP_ID=MMETSP0052_2-20121109/22635_1 /TAXON_ID=51329 ORGANISM="Polytomella parva, Strain SAG 63-3" /NCGR_SAMPLE_ID=MMETSP0052_2 /ASSEMBLY_ACC=CAM_ASM_000194 /LENGTH=31 /DNA_ID= /DNA_START= /DNA_END= /DNA_ORIENTATION=